MTSLRSSKAQAVTILASAILAIIPTLRAQQFAQSPASSTASPQGNQNLMKILGDPNSKGELGKTESGQIVADNLLIQWHKRPDSELPNIDVQTIYTTRSGVAHEDAGWQGTDKLGNKFISIAENTLANHEAFAYRITYTPGKVQVTKISVEQVPEGLDESWGDYHPAEVEAHEGGEGATSGSPLTPIDDSGKRAILTFEDDTRAVTLVAGVITTGRVSVWKDDKTGETFLVKKDGSTQKATRLASNASSSTWKIGRGTTVVVTTSGEATFNYDQTK